MTMDDITNYNVIEGEPVTTTFKSKSHDLLNSVKPESVEGTYR